MTDASPTYIWRQENILYMLRLVNNTDLTIDIYSIYKISVVTTSQPTTITVGKPADQTATYMHN